MSRPGWTTKPCEGCHKPGRRGTGELCIHCQNMLKIGREECERREQEVTQGKAIAVTYQTTLKAPAYGYVPHYQNSPRERFCLAFRKLLDSLGPEVPYYFMDKKAEELLGYKYRYDNHDRVTRMIPVAVIPHIRDLADAIFDLTEESYQQGHKTGRNLLTGLATGQCSVDDFNESCLKNREI